MGGVEEVLRICNVARHWYVDFGWAGKTYDFAKEMIPLLDNKYGRLSERDKEIIGSDYARARELMETMQSGNC